MRFISKYGRFGLQVRWIVQEAYATGMAKVIQEPIYADFYPNKLRPHERELAVNSWNFNGSYQEQDRVSTVPPDYRIGLFDSEEAQSDKGWSDAIRIEVEESLTAYAGRYPWVMVVPRSSIPAPWPTYDDYHGSAEELVEKLVEDGYNLDAALTYEREMQNRPEVIEAIEQEISGVSKWTELELEEEVRG